MALRCNTIRVKGPNPPLDIRREALGRPRAERAGVPRCVSLYEPPNGDQRRTVQAVWRPKRAATYAESKMNVHRRGQYTAAEGTAPAWAAATGWTFTAASLQYLTTGLAPGANYTVVACFSGLTGGGQWPYGEYVAGVIFGLAPNEPGGVQAYYGGASRFNLPAMPAGTYGQVAARNFRNGVEELAGGAWGVGVPAELYLGCLNFAGPVGHISGVLTLIAVWSSDIAAYIASLYRDLLLLQLTV